MNKLLFLLSLFSVQVIAQQAEYLKLKKYETAVLSDSLKENSGLTFFKEKLYTFNDGGNTSEIFEINKSSGKINKTHKTSLTNIDWEAIASDSTSLYVADFGNNAGTRTDLKIYRIPLQAWDSVHAKNIAEIPYYYPEQKDFTRRIINNDYDAEAMLYLNGKLHLFTKEWVARSVTHYIIDPLSTGNQAAQKVESFPTGFVVTDAEYFQGRLYLVGYTKKTEVFLSVFNETEPGIFFSGASKKYYLGSSLSVGQIEGIAVDTEGIYISGEEFRTPLGKAAQRLYLITHQELK